MYGRSVKYFEINLLQNCNQSVKQKMCLRHDHNVSQVYLKNFKGFALSCLMYISINSN